MKLTDEQSKTVEENHNLIYGFANMRKINLDEHYGTLAIELCNTVKHWNPQRSNLSTYFYIRANNRMRMEYRKKFSNKRKANEDSLELKLDILNYPNDELAEDLILQDMIKHGDSEIILLKYQGYSQDEIAEKLGVSQATISRELTDTFKKYTP